jgi:hypothetical protein
MSDNKARTPDRKFALIAPIVIGLAAIGVLIVLLLRPSTAPPPKVEPTPAPPPLVAAAPAPSAPASRDELISGADAAASAYAAGDTLGASDLIGRKFTLRLAFGCGGPTADPGPVQAYYQLDNASRTVRLVARPANWTDLPLVRAAPAPEATEAVEGFWIPRPWLRTDGCPHRREVAPPATPTPVEAPSLGVAMFHAADAPRAQRRGDRPYEYVYKLPAGGDGQGLSFSLLLEGRISGFADHAAVHCWGESINHRPVCLYGVDIDRVAFEDAKGEVLAQWPT